MKKLLLVLLLVPIFSYSQSEMPNQVNIGKTKLIFPNALVKSSALGFKTYDLTNAYPSSSSGQLDSSTWYRVGTTVASDNINDNVYRNGNVGIGGVVTPTSTLHIQGSEAGTVTNITGTTTLNETHHKVLVSNGATNITITLPNALTCLGREYVISRASGSTGSITVVGGAGNTIQALNGTVGATTSIGLHSATGGGLRHSFTAVNIAGVGVWVRL